MQEDIHLISFILYWIVFLSINFNKKHKKNELEDEIFKNIIPSTVIWLNTAIVCYSLFTHISEHLKNRRIWR